MIRLALLGAIVVALAGPARWLLVRARWTERAPRAGIALWQSLVAAVALALSAGVVEAFALPDAAVPARRVVTDSSPQGFVELPSGGASPESLFLLTVLLIAAALLIGALALRAVGLARARTRRRMLIDLVSFEHAAIPGVRVLPHAEATAFSLAGVHPRVVVSDGAIDLLEPDELAAVVAHERAHVRARHDLVLLPFATLSHAFPRSRALAAARHHVGLLAELAADDRVLRETPDASLARALCRLATSGVLLESRASGDDAPRRMERALARPSRSKTLAGTAALASSAVLLLPVAALLLPLGGR